MKLKNMFAILLAGLMVTGLASCACDRQEYTDDDDDDRIDRPEITNKDFFEDHSEVTTSQWKDLESPSVEQEVKLSVSQIADQLELRILNHSEYADSTAFLNGQKITYEGNEMNIDTGLYSEGGDRFMCTYTIKGNNLYSTPISIVPAEQDWVGLYSFECDELDLGASLTVADEIIFDGLNGITLKNVSGEFFFDVSPVRGGPVPFAYGISLNVKGTVNEPSDITFTWDDEGLIIRSTEDIQYFCASTTPGFMDYATTYAESAQKYYHVSFVKEEYTYTAIIE